MNPLFPPPATSGKSLLARMEDALLPLINLVFLLLMFFIVAGQLAGEPLPELPGSQSSPHSSATPAAIGVAIDVPAIRTAWHVAWFGSALERADMMKKPGAPTLMPTRSS